VAENHGLIVPRVKVQVGIRVREGNKVRVSLPRVRIILLRGRFEGLRFMLRVRTRIRVGFRVRITITIRIRVRIRVRVRVREELCESPLTHI